MALDDGARFCVACGAPFNWPPEPVVEPAPPARAAGSPFIDAAPVQWPGPRVTPPTRPEPTPLPPRPVVDLPPMVPKWMILLGVLGMVALFVIFAITG